MLFNSAHFLVFMALVLVSYHALHRNHRLQNRLLLGASYVFYGWASWTYCLILMVSTGVNFALGRRIHTAADQSSRRRWLWVSLAFNLGVLGAFKYFGFFLQNIAAVLGIFGMEMTWSLELILPIGISFYTFQTLSYTIDIYRKRFEPVDNLFDFALFVAFFPQLLMGPIERAAHLLPQIERPRSVTSAHYFSGSWLIFLGLYKKIFVADQIAQLCDPLFAVREVYAGGDVALGAVLFAIQIYADFSGYSDVARGSARMLGFDIVQNFRAPYFARNIQDYWSRWHMSLTMWIRDYVFFPMAVSRRWSKKLGAGGLVLVTMVIMGLWHGATWVFVLWGLYHGFILAIYRRVRPYLFRNTQYESRLAKTGWHIVCVLFTFSLVAVSELFFRPGGNGEVSSLSQCGSMCWALLTNPTTILASTATIAAVVKICAVLFVLDLAESWSDSEETVLSWPTLLRRLVQAIMLFSMMNALTSQDTSLGQPFRYFQV